jgi:hypothetical protein
MERTGEAPEQPCRIRYCRPSSGYGSGILKDERRYGPPGIAGWNDVYKLHHDHSADLTQRELHPIYQRQYPTLKLKAS